MGYCMTQRDSMFTIKKENKEAALEAIKELAKPEKMEGKASGGRWSCGSNGKREEIFYSWVTTSDFLNASCLEDAIRAWRWCLESDNDSGDVIGIYFEGEKLGNDEILFDAIAPFVEEGSFLEMSGEDGALWRWSFDGKEMEEKYANINWE